MHEIVYALLGKVCHVAERMRTRNYEWLKVLSTTIKVVHLNIDRSISVEWISFASVVLATSRISKGMRDVVIDVLDALVDMTWW